MGVWEILNFNENNYSKNDEWEQILRIMLTSSENSNRPEVDRMNSTSKLSTVLDNFSDSSVK